MAEEELLGLIATAEKGSEHPLAQSDIGIAIGSGSDVAKETGGIILVKDDLRDVVGAIKLSKATMGQIKQNRYEYDQKRDLNLKSLKFIQKG